MAKANAYRPSEPAVKFIERKTFEYKTVNLPVGEEAAVLTREGQDGWEVVPPLPAEPMIVEAPGANPNRYLARLALLKRESANERQVHYAPPPAPPGPGANAE